MDKEEDWETMLPTALLALRTARNRHTGVTPFFALYGREAKIPVDLIYENPPAWKQHQTIYGHELERRMQLVYKHMRTRINSSIERARMSYNGQLKGKKVENGDLVWLFTPKVKPGVGKKLTTFWSGPWEVTELISSVLFKIKTGSWNRRQFEVVVSLDRLQPFLGSSTTQVKTNLIEADVVIADEFLEQQELEFSNHSDQKAVQVTYAEDPTEILDRLPNIPAPPTGPPGPLTPAPPPTPPLPPHIPPAAPASPPPSPSSMATAPSGLGEDNESLPSDHSSDWDPVEASAPPWEGDEMESWEGGQKRPLEETDEQEKWYDEAGRRQQKRDRVKSPPSLVPPSVLPAAPLTKTSKRAVDTARQLLLDEPTYYTRSRARNQKQ
jgi:hypothetical protein